MATEKTIIEAMPTMSLTIASRDDQAGTFSWADTLLETEDPFFAKQAENVLAGVRLVDVEEPEAFVSGDQHRERFSRLLGAAVKPPKSSDRT